ncbi:MAG TPA: hypothetical protein VLK89_01420 [Solirubrobacterales bacterium]|nr:hypothetical protein [Solirubrobacterales bacterium]
MGRPRDTGTTAPARGEVIERGKLAQRRLLEYRAEWADDPPAKGAEVAEILAPYDTAARAAFDARVRHGSPDPTAEVAKAEAAKKAVAELDDLLGPPRLHKVPVGGTA